MPLTALESLSIVLPGSSPIIGGPQWHLVPLEFPGKLTLGLPPLPMTILTWTLILSCHRTSLSAASHLPVHTSLFEVGDTDSREV